MTVMNNKALKPFYRSCAGVIFFLLMTNVVFAQSKAKKEVIEEPIVVNGDTVEYSTDNKEISASGNVKIIYKGTHLSCDKITVNTQTKNVKASGNVKIEDEKGLIEGQEILYNFQEKTGTVLNAKFRAYPYFGKAEKVERVSESEFVAYNGYVTTCDLDHPHYRISSKEIHVFPGDKIQTRNDAFYLADVPVLYLPAYNHSLKDPLYHVQLNPGHSGDWGAYMLSAWRYSLTDHVTGRIYLDYRSKLGLAEGFGANYNTPYLGKGDFKFYYTHEQPDNLSSDEPHEFQRYLIRLRHKWDIDDRTKLTGEYYRIEDSKRQVAGTNNFLKEYFYREYEKDAQPLSYLLVNHMFNYSSLNVLVQPRTNRWFGQTEKLPELNFELPEYKLGDSPVYFKNSTLLSNLDKEEPVPTDFNQHVVRYDTYNQFSLPFKASIFSLTPFVGGRETFYSRDKDGNSLDPRTVLYSGIDMSTKFYRLFDVQSDLLGMDINGLRHILTPTVKYAYNHDPTVPASKLAQFDAIDAITQGNKVTLELTNKFQTKHINEKDDSKTTVDLATFKVSSDYTFQPEKETGIAGSAFSDFLFDLELLPYSWLRIESDAAYDHFGDNVRQANVNFHADLGHERYVGLGHRYERKGGKELTSEFGWRLNPKWKIRIYERYQFARVKEKGFKEQEYTFTRDLHCWLMDLTYNVSEENGHSVWVAFRLKAFPETEFGYNQSLHSPKASSEDNP